MEPELTPIANIQAEAALIGALLFNNSAFDIAVEYVGADDFYEPVHQRIYAAVQDTIALGHTASPVTLRPIFADDPAIRELGGPEYLATLTGDGGGATAGVRDFARQIADLARLRRLHDESAEVLVDMRDLSGGVNPAKHAARLEAIAFDTTSTKADRLDIFSAADSVRRTVAQVRKVQATGDPIGVVVPDIVEFSQLVGPMIRKHLIIVAARPGMGKSALMCGIARSAATGDTSKPPEERRQYGVGIVSLEMGDIDLGQRFSADVAYAMDEKILHASIRDAKLSEREMAILEMAADDIDKLPIKMVDASGITLSRLGMIARRMKRELQAEGHDLELLVVDYLQLLNGDGRFENKTTEITQISQGLKELAKQLDCCVMALSQLSRAVEQREIKIPQLSDLRESGSIEQDADVVAFLYRQSYYLAHKEPDRGTKPSEWNAWKDAMELCENDMDIIVPKARNGAGGRASVKFLRQYQAVRGRTFFSSKPGALFDA